MDLETLSPVILQRAVVTRGSPVTVRAFLPGLDKWLVLKASEAGNHIRKCGGTSLEPEPCPGRLPVGQRARRATAPRETASCMTLCHLAHLATRALEKACTVRAQTHYCHGTCWSGFRGLIWALAPSSL